MDFEQLYKAYYMQVYSYVMTLARNPEKSEEITQKAFFKAMLSFKKFRGESSCFTWLCAIAKNIFLDMQRTEKRRSDKEPPDTDSGRDIQAEVEDKDTALRIHKILHTMEEPYKEVFQLRVFGELSFRDIAVLFGKTESWARVTYHRAKLRIREKLEE